MVAAVVAATYWRFLWHLPPPSRLGMMLAGAAYVGGGLGVELISGRLFADHGRDSVPYAAAAVIEETLELTGVAILLRTLWALLGRLAPDLVLHRSDVPA